MADPTGPTDDHPSTRPSDRPQPTGPGVGVSGGAGAAAQVLPELVALLLSTPSVEAYLVDLARTAASALAPPRCSCGITLRRDGRALTVASSDDLALAVDEVQYGLGAGPCLEALETGTVVTSPDMSGEDRWDGYIGRAQSYGIASSLSVPLVSEGKAVGALNLYSRTAHAFDGPEAVAKASALAAQASSLLTVLLRQARQAQLSTSLREALSSRSVIDQALGIVMAQQRCTAEEAFAVLRAASQHRNRKLRDVAADVVRSATGRAPQPAPFDESP